MKKIAFFILFAFVINVAKAQIVINSRFKPFTYDEMVAPLREANRAYEVAEQQFELYFEKSNIELEKYKNQQPYNASLGIYYIDKCLKINNRFNESMGDNGVLYYMKGVWYLIKNEKENAKKYLKYAWDKYKNETARVLMERIQ